MNLANAVNDYVGISRAYIALGNINSSIHDYENAKKMYTLALDVARKHSLNTYIGVALGNLAKEKFEKDTLKSLARQKEALTYLNKVKGTEEEQAYILINMGW